MGSFDPILVDPNGPIELKQHVTRVYGFLYVTEHRNYGDVQWETAIEPSHRVQKTPIGTPVSIDRETHMVELLSTYPCRVAFCPDGEDLANAESHAFPVPADTLVTRLIPMNTVMSVVTFPGY